MATALERLMDSDEMSAVVCAHLEESLEVFQETGKGDPDYKKLTAALRRVIQYYGGAPGER